MAIHAELRELARSLLARAPESHKGDFGSVLVIGGSGGMAGAPSLAGMAALRSGAGRVTIAAPRGCQAIVAGFNPCYMTVGLSHDGADHAATIASSNRDLLDKLFASMTAVAIGPGLGRSSGVTTLVKHVYATCPLPVVVDADGLNALAETRDLLVASARAPSAGLRILTPHPGEFARLIGRRIEDRAEQQSAAEQLARNVGAIVVLKGHRTIITDGQRTTINATGNPGMATGGTGDVLTGVILALVCQIASPFEATCLAVHVHGLAGDLAAASVGQVSLIATDLIEQLAVAFQQTAELPSREDNAIE